MGEALIDQLAADLKPIARGTVQWRLSAGLAIGAAIAAVALWLWLGLRIDLQAALATPVFWIKFGYPLLLGIGGFLALERLARPGGVGARGFFLAVGALLVCAALAVLQLAGAPASSHRLLVLGSSALICPFLIVTLSAPALVATMAVLRRLAPTSLTLAGLAAGLLSGGAGAWVYAFHCGEAGLPFLAIWYTLGVAMNAALGAFLGRYLLRW